MSKENDNHNNMGLFSNFKKPTSPYMDESTNLIYELLFCDNIELYKSDNTHKENYPWNILFSDVPTVSNLKTIADSTPLESRTRILAFNKLREIGVKIEKKELLGVIVEVGLENGLDVVASYSNGTARYINQAGKIVILETTENKTSNTLISQIFNSSVNVVNHLSPKKEQRQKYPTKGQAKITFLVSDGLYFMDGPANALFNDTLSAPVLISTMNLMKYLMDISKKESSNL